MLGRVLGRRELLCVTRARSEGRVFVTCYLPDGSDVVAIDGTRVTVRLASGDTLSLDLP